MEERQPDAPNYTGERRSSAAETRAANEDGAGRGGLGGERSRSATQATQTDASDADVSKRVFASPYSEYVVVESNDASDAIDGEDPGAERP